MGSDRKPVAFPTVFLLSLFDLFFWFCGFQMGFLAACLTEGVS